MTTLPPPSRNQKIILSLAVFLPHLALLYALLFELDSPYLLRSLLLMLIFFAATGFGIEAGFHRLLTHRAFQSGNILKIILVALGSMAAQGPVLAWVANHRRHHMFSDGPGDPHSPTKGLYHAHFGWFLSVGQSSVVRYAPDLLMDKALVRLNQSYWLLVALGIAIPGVILGLLSASWDGFLSGILWGGLVRVCITHNALGSINSICHRYGSRPFKIPGASTNNHWLAIPTLGQSLHNNHHAFPQAASTSFAWWELDLSGVALRVLKAFRLVSYQPLAREEPLK